MDKIKLERTEPIFSSSDIKDIKVFIPQIEIIQIEDAVKINSTTGDEVLFEKCKITIRDPISLRVIENPIIGQNCTHSFLCYDRDSFQEYYDQVIWLQQKNFSYIL